MKREFWEKSRSKTYINTRVMEETKKKKKIEIYTCIISTDVKLKSLV